MKHSFLGLALLLSALVSTAQPAVQTGLNLASYRYTFDGSYSERDLVIGLNAGVLYRLRLPGRLALEPSLLYSRKGARRITDNTAAIDYIKVKLDYIQLSLPLLYRIGFTRHLDFNFGGGPYAAYLLSAASRTHFYVGDDEQTKLKIGSDGAAHDFRQGDAGLRLMAGAHLRKLYFYLSYDLGLVNVTPRQSETIRTRCFGANLALFF